MGSEETYSGSNGGGIILAFDTAYSVAFYLVSYCFVLVEIGRFGRRFLLLIMESVFAKFNFC